MAVVAMSGAMDVRAQDVRAISIVVVEGEGAFNDIKRERAHNPVVEILDQRERPVAGAKVTFTLPYSGPGGKFANGETSYTAVTKADGRAVVTGLKPNSIEGRFNIKVVASYLDKEATAVIAQSNTLAGQSLTSGSSRKKLLIIGLIGGAAVGGILAATGGGGGSGPALPPTVLSVGTITVGGPR